MRQAFFIMKSNETTSCPLSLAFVPAVTVTEHGDTAHVRHESGLGYMASGYTSAADNMLTFTNGLILTFDPSDTAVPFNRFTLGYTSTQPLHGIIRYTSDGTETADDFYLEAGTHTFSCVIGQYLADKNAVGIASMTFRTCSRVQADFALCVLRTEMYPVYGINEESNHAYDNTHFIENDRFRLGIRLCWGGGINYIEDKTAGIDGLTNLINQHDT